MKKEIKKVILGMSGGLDSSTALYFLKEQGFEVLGVFLKFFFFDEKEQKKRIESTQKLCKRFGFKHLVLEAQKDFEKKVFSYFLNTLKQNETPSPCLFCNREVKIELLYKLAQKRKIPFVATGHYARIKDKKLFKARDKQKDQSYFLALLKKKHLKKLIFPLGELSYSEVKKIAVKQKIEVPEKSSQDLCFINDKKFDQFLEKELGRDVGEIVNAKGEILGEHKGLCFYTIGQRKGIELAGGPFWVVGFNKKKNQLIVTDKKDSPLLLVRKVVLKDLNFLVKKRKEFEVEAKVRYRQSLAKARLVVKGNRAELLFQKPQRAVTPGQIAVFYKKDLCLGGGVITNKA